MNSYEKVLKILLAFTPNNRPLKTVEISSKLGMNNATVSRILVTLKNKHFVVQDEKTRHYRLGPSAALLGRSVKQSLRGRLVSIAKPYIENLRDKVSETVHLEALHDENIFLVYSAKGLKPVTVTPHVGDRMAVNSNAGAKAIMAFCPKEIIEQHLVAPMAVYTTRTVTNPDTLRKEYEEIRATGFAYDNEEHDDDVSAVAAPIFNHEGQIAAAAVIIAPSFRMSGSIESGSLELLKDTATAISNRLSKL